MQKSIYLLQALGMPETKDYSFSYYFRGPYCPALAKDYYALQENRIAPTKTTIPSHAMSIVKECVERGDSFLEAVATLHLISKIRRSSDQMQIVSAARSLKPQLAQRYDEAWDFLRAAGLL